MKSIQSLCVASLLVGACVLASPGIAAAQDTSPRQVKVEENANRQIDHQQADHPVASQQVVHQVNQVVQTGHVTRRVTTTRRGNRVITRTTRTHVLCEDGTWSYTGCGNHGGLAARQYTPRASDQAILHANAHSAVARAYANRVRTSAVARCNDGTYWHATNHVRACSGHGGVARWY